MTTGKEENVKLELEIHMQTALSRRNSLFARLQSIYNLSKVVHSNQETLEEFLCSCINVDTLRTEFGEAVDRYNVLMLKLDPRYKVDDKSWASFEELFCRIKYLYLKLSPSGSSADRCSANDRHERKTVKQQFRLPAIELMSFDGEVTNWPLFYASYKIIIHENDALSDAEKIHYLLGKLSPKAQTAFAGIRPDAENYNIIFDSLVDKYEDKRVLAATYLNQIFEYKPFTTASIDNLESFSDKLVSAVNGLKRLNIDNLDDFIMLHVALKKLDPETVRLFEMNSKDVRIPKFESLTKFVKGQYRILQNTAAMDSSSLTSVNVAAKKSILRVNNNNKDKSKLPQPQSYVSVSDSYKCLCSDIVHEHLYKCPAFSNMVINDRFKFVKSIGACVNCLSIKHKAKSCQSNIKCKLCFNRHHTLLHFDQRNSNPLPAPVVANTVLTAGAETPSPASDTAVAHSSLSHAHPDSDSDEETTLPLCNASTTAPGLIARGQLCTAPVTVLLSTAVVTVCDSFNREQNVRCLLDTGSQSHFITTDCCKRLGLTKINTYNCSKIKGIGGAEKSVKGSVDFQFSSRFNSKVKYNVSSLVVDNITDNLPTAPVDISALPYLQGLPLADDSFGTPGRIDMLLGASLVPHLLLPGVASSNSSAPPAIQTVLGYVIMGTVPALPTSHTSTSLAFCCTTSRPNRDDSLDTLLKQFWQIDEAPIASLKTTESRDDIECEYFYRETTERDKVSGRYTVALPFREDVFSLGNSLDIARKRYFCLERKLESSPELRTAYNDIIHEYIDNGYLSPAPTDSSSHPDYVIPHHAVIRLDRTTTKIRTVLDASCKTSSGVSLNDILHSGSNLQGDLFNIILRFRSFAIALSADCRQMFMQIGVRECDRRFQRILYRFNTDEPLKVYQFNRVCFGLKSSPFHALRTVQQLVEDDGHLYPHAKDVASNSLYMDDIVFSVKSESHAVNVAQELIGLFKKGQFDLVKWTSNSQNVLDSIPSSHKLMIEFEKSGDQKVLGLRWSKVDDHFEFRITAPDGKCTKRAILSTVARLWDVMGFVAPVVLFAKLLIKELWLLKLEWDDSPPIHIINTWQRFCIALPTLNNLKIPRHIGVYNDCEIRLIGFSDASEHAYGAVIYAHITQGDNIMIQLICAKSKVSPVKPLTIARLELCGAELLAKLLRRVHDAYDAQFKISDLFAFTDSKVTLCWLNSSPHRWQTFVANRVVKTTDNIPAKHFYHVAGLENPADCLSRGLMPDKLIEHPLWLHGPPWARLSISEWPINKIDELDIDTIPEERIHANPVVSHEEKESIISQIAKRVSSWSKLLRTVVLIYRFLKRLPYRRAYSVSVSDLNFAEHVVWRHVQNNHFSEDIKSLQGGKSCSTVLIKLKPFVANQLIRVGGRLTYSAESFDKKHPIVLPRHDRIVELLVEYYHKKYLHAGPELLMSLLRDKYWILSARRIIRYKIHKCNTCYKWKPRSGFAPTMSDLPEQRVVVANKAFSHTGCDYAGPIQYVPMRGRGVRSRKAYLCIFTCMTTRAIHVELATDLTTVSFIAALKRFLARRGPVQHLYSDNGTNFRGASSYLRDLYDFLNKEYHSSFQLELTRNDIEWHFIPPASPHFGGCWESVVKTVKTHLFKTIGQQLLSYEELSTILTQIECLLNSRPLTVLSSDPSEPKALTPAHFLHTAPLYSFPSPDVSTTSENLLDRHSLLDKMIQSFWKRWRGEYLHTLQTRQKWNKPDGDGVKEGTVVIIMSDNLPPLSWPLGVVEKLHPSKDGLTRVVSVKTSKGTFVRPVVKLCPLPTQ